MRILPFDSAARIAVLYALIAGLWILGSDRLVGAFTQDPRALAWGATYKGWAFVAVTALLLETSDAAAAHRGFERRGW